MYIPIVKNKMQIYIKKLDSDMPYKKFILRPFFRDKHRLRPQQKHI